MSKVCDLPSAVDEIVRTNWSGARGDRFASPYFLIFGAGISDPPVPVASKLETRFRAEIERLGLEQPPVTSSQADAYYDCIDRVFPNPELRREFLSRLIKGHKPSAANVQVAHLLGPRGLTNLGITPNFDCMLPLALRQQGLEALVYDHPETIIRRFHLSRREIQVLQIHGTYEHYDFCNLREEIRDRARTLSPSLHALLLQRSPIVVGYSGWENDAIMTALELRLREARGSMAGGLHWFCYTQADADMLPGWLKDDPSVRVIVPAGNGAGQLPAVRVFDALLQGLEQESQSAAAARARKPKRPAAPGAVATIAAAEKAAAQEDWEQAVAELRPLDPGSLSAGEKAFCCTVLEQIYQGTLETKPSLSLEACRLWQAVASGEIGKTNTLQRLMFARAVYGEGLALLALGRRADAIAKLTDVQALCRDERLLATRAAHADNALAVALFREGRKEEAVAHWHELLRRSESEPEVQEARAYALFNLGLASKKTGKIEDALLYWSALRDRAAPSEGVSFASDLRSRVLGELREMRLFGLDVLAHIPASARGSDQIAKLAATIATGTGTDLRHPLFGRDGDAVERPVVAWGADGIIERSITETKIEKLDDDVGDNRIDTVCDAADLVVTAVTGRRDDINERSTSIAPPGARDMAAAGLRSENMIEALDGDGNGNRGRSIYTSSWAADAALGANRIPLGDSVMAGNLLVFPLYGHLEHRRPQRPQLLSDRAGATRKERRDPARAPYFAVVPPTGGLPFEEARAA